MFAFATTLAGFIAPQVGDWANSWVEVVASIWLISASMADIIITMTLVWDLVRWQSSILYALCADTTMDDLVKSKRKSGLRYTDNVLNRLFKSSFLCSLSQFNAHRFTLFSDDTNRVIYFAICIALSLVARSHEKISTF